MNETNTTGGNGEAVATSVGLAGDPSQRPTRALTPEERQCIEEMYKRKARFKPANGYVTTTTDLPMSHWDGEHPPDDHMTVETIPAGTTLKIVMVSRMGDCGLSTDLAGDYGYGLRLDWEDTAMTDIRLCPKPRQPANH